MQAADSFMKRQDKNTGLQGKIEDKTKEAAVTSPAEETLQRIREEVFLYVWAPVLTAYVEWVIREAVRSGKKRLYFLARDGFMMYRMAEKLVKERKIDLDLRYLKISRFAVRNAEYGFAGKEALHTLCAGGIDVSFEKIMKRAGLTEEEALHIAKLTGYIQDYKTMLNYRQLRSLKEKLFVCDSLFVYIRRHAKGNYDTAASYFKQEGLLDKIPYALVDSGWAGTLQLSLQRILEHETGERVRLQGYYFGLYARPAGTDKEQYKAFYFGEKDIVRKIRFSNCLFETVFSAPEGMTYGYGTVQNGGGKRKEAKHAEKQPVGVNPDLQGEGRQKRSGLYQALERDGRNPNRLVIERFAELLEPYAERYVKCTKLTDAGGISDSKASKKMCKNLLSLMMGNPTPWEAEAFGSLLFCDDVLELQWQQAAVLWDEKELRMQRFFNKLLIKMNVKRGILHESAWPEGSIVRAGGTVGKNMRQERLYKGFMYLRKAVLR